MTKCKNCKTENCRLWVDKTPNSFTETLRGNPGNPKIELMGLNGYLGNTEGITKICAICGCTKPEVKG